MSPSWIGWLTTLPFQSRSHNVRKLSSLDPLSFEPIYNREELDEIYRISLKMEFATTETEVHQDDLAFGRPALAQELLANITNKVILRAKLTSAFAELLPIVRTYLTQRCFGGPVDLDIPNVRAHLERSDLRDGVAKYLARKIAELTVEKKVLEFENAAFKLSDTKPFSWRRNLPPLTANHTVFNYVATYNDFERRFAQFLDGAADVLRFASLGTTEQGESGTQFRVDYLKPSGAIGFYYPDWAAIQTTAKGDVNWILETKGRAWEDTAAKETAMHDWCERISEATGQIWKHARVNQIDFHDQRPKTLAEAVSKKCLAPTTPLLS